MRKRIIGALLIVLCIILTACSSKQGSEVQNNTPSQTAKTDYSKYTGTWVTESNLINDFKYGMVAGINVDKDGNIKGQVSDSTENLAHISNVDVNGKIQDDKFSYNFSEDGWEHSGTINMEFKDNKIVLTITYNSTSSKNNLWGIGVGTFTLINNKTEVKRTLSNLKDGGLQVFEDQCFNVALENYGKVKFISGLKREDANDNANFYLIDDNNNVLYKFPDFYGNQKGMFRDVKAVSFTDVNGDGLKDAVIIADYNNGIICSIYFQKGKEFINDNALDDKINASKNNKSIAEAIKYAKKMR